MHNPVFTSTYMFIMAVVTVASFSLVILVVPNMFLEKTFEAKPTAKPHTPLQLAGRDVYISEGCHVCHTLMVRPVEAEILRYGPAETPEDDVYEHPFLWGSKRAGPDLSNIGGKFSNKWHELHLIKPQDLVPVSIMPPFPWLFKKLLDPEEIQPKMRALRMLGVPYTDEQIAQARLEVTGRTEGEALISYLQQLGVHRMASENTLKGE